MCIVVPVSIISDIDCSLSDAGADWCCVSSVSNHIIGLDVPFAKVGNGGIGVGNLGGKNGYFWGINGNGSWSYYQLSNPVLGIITPAQAQAFDTKIDDGLANTGNVYAAWMYGGDNRIHPEWAHAGYNCLTFATPNAYNISYLGSACSLWINIQGM